MLKKQSKKLATLTKAEDSAYSDAFGYYLSNVRNDSNRADRYAWKETVRAFPRLAKFDGAKP